MNANCNHPCETLTAPLMMEEGDHEKLLCEVIDRQAQFIKVAIDYLKSGEPHQARRVLEAAQEIVKR